MDTVRVKGLDIAYTCAGAGPPVLLVHGFVGDGATTWAHQIDALSDEFTVVAWDCPGAGRSSVPPAGFGMRDYADCLAGFADALGFGHPHLVGLSFGGAVLLDVFRGDRSLFPRSLVLAGSYAGWAGSLPAEEVDRRVAEGLRLARGPREEFAATLLPTMFAAPPSSPEQREFLERAAAFDPEGFTSMLLAVAAADQRDMLAAVDVPTLVVHAEHDVRSRREVADALAAGIAGSRMAVLPGAGHVSPLEAPDAFTGTVRAFLRQIPV